MDRYKVRLRFQKFGTLRFLSHHDLMRCLERMMRRTAIPFRSTDGFHPTPRVAFALSLSLGLAGRNEIVDIELTRAVPPAELLTQLNDAAPQGLAFTAAHVVPANQSAQVVRACYAMALPLRTDLAETAARVIRFLAATEHWVVRRKPTPRQVNIRPFVRDVQLSGGRLEMDCWVTGVGTAKAGEILAALGLGAWLADGGVLERTNLILADESEAQPPPLELATLSRRLSRAEAIALADADDQEPVASAMGDWELSPNGPVVE